MFNDPIRAALNDIVTWSTDLPAWQRDALRRLYVKHKLESVDKDELYILCRQVHGLLEDGETAFIAQPLETRHIPANMNSGGIVALKSIGHAKNVNALADDQTLHFAETGLTVVYGDNGSGKSGYGRVLKRACRARDQEDILPNAYAALMGKPAASIKYSLAGVVQPEISWQDGTAAPPELSNISVFDSKCASVHVSGPNDLAYTPVPLELLQDLADIAREIGNKLRGKKSSVEARVPSFRKKSSLQVGSAVQQFVAGLSANTSIAALTSLTQMSENETIRLEQLKRDLASDPVKEVRRLKALKERVEQLAKVTESAEYVLMPNRVDELRQLLLTAKDKATAAQLAASEAFKGELLPQAGSEVWKTLWEAARAFSSEEAYPSESFPKTDDDAVCVLCQQPLSPSAATRLAAFEKFVQQKVQSAAEDARNAVQTWKEKVGDSSPNEDVVTEAVRLLRDEIDTSTLCGQVVRILIRARFRARKLVAATEPESLLTRRMVVGVGARLNELIVRLERRMAELQKSSNPDQRKLQENELRGLEDRAWLAGIKSDVEEEIERLKKIAAFDMAIQDADTYRITRKTTELSKTLVTDTVRDAFAAEMAELSISDRRLELIQEASGYGSTKFKVSLIRNPKTKVASILSEGELRCVALAAFIAELSTAHNRSGIVFDDPVSSLDHNYRGFFAKRLAKEAAGGRQVIVFTHDIPFLMMLDEAARAQALSPSYQCVNRASDRAGICVAGAPQKAQPVPEIVNGIERRLSSAQALHTSGRLDEWAVQAKAMVGLLRDGWERAAETFVAPVVRRYNNKVHPGGLHLLTVLEEEDITDFNEGYNFACIYCHTDAPELNRPAPTPDQIKAEIGRLRNWFESVNKRQDQKK